MKFKQPAFHGSGLFGVRELAFEDEHLFYTDALQFTVFVIELFLLSPFHVNFVFEAIGDT